MPQVSLFRLYLMRALYALIAIGLGMQIWPLLFHHRPWEVMHSTAVCLLAALSALALLGVRYPLQMLPLLLFELFWKALWLGAIAYPAWRGGPLSQDMRESIFACGLGIIVPIVIPWPYVWANYVKKAGDRWG